MKNRIISFILMLAILFSCLSLEIFATQSGDSSTEAVTGAQSAKASDDTDKLIAEYFEKFGTIGKSGGYNLTAALTIPPLLRAKLVRYQRIL